MFKKIKGAMLVPALALVAMLLVGCFGLGQSSVKVSSLSITKNSNPATPGITVTVELDKDLDLDKAENNIEIAYFVVENNVKTPIKNSVEGEEDLVKNKGWAGFLVNNNVKYVKGTPGADDYNEEFSNLLKADTKYSTLLRNGAASDGPTMEYHSLDWNQEYTFEVVVTITTKEGKSSFTEKFNYTPTV